MNNKARLVVTDTCYKNCDGCCMKDWKESIKIISFDELLKYEEIYITGGEPMLFPIEITSLIGRLKGYDKKVYLYTAHVYPCKLFKDIMQFLDGASITLHNEKDKHLFKIHYKGDEFVNKSMRLNDFTNSPLIKCGDNWEVRRKKWIKNCPLPDGEDIVRLDYFYLYG